MMNFLKSFFSNEKSPEEQALLARKHDVLSVQNFSMEEEEGAEEEGSCAPSGGCGGCGCRQ